MPLRLDIKRKLLARSDRVKSVDLHPTEPWMLVSLYIGTIHVWNYENQTMVKSFEVTDLPVRAAKFIGRKNWIIAGADDMQIRVFNYNTLEKVHNFEAHSDYIRAIAVHPTQPYVLTSSDDMMIKLWDWDRNWNCAQVFEGHSHFVMQIVFNPKDTNTFASASLDRTVKVWQLGSSVPNFTLEGHEKGVNCVDYFQGGEKPYLITGGDDRLVKIWDYQTKSCVQTLEGHTQNLSVVCFHPELPIIISGSEDGTVRIWHANTYRLENTLNYGLERVWSLSYLRGSNSVAIGYDEGAIMIKLGREDPVCSMDGSGKIIWAHHNEIQQANLKTVGPEVEINDGERLPLSSKELGSCEVYPQTLIHNPNGRFVVVCGDGEYTIYTALAWRNKSYGSALEFVWSSDSSEYAVRESSSKIKTFRNFKERKVLRHDFGAEGIFGGALLGVRSSNFLALYDWESLELVRRIETVPKYIFWSEDGLLMTIAAEESFFVLRYNKDVVAKHIESGQPVGDEGIEEGFEFLGEVQESVRTGAWVGDCFVYTNGTNRLNYYVGGEVVTLGHLDRPLFLLGYIPTHSRVYLADKDMNVVSYYLSLAVLEYQTAVIRKDFDAARSILPTVPNKQRNRVAQFLEKQGFKEQALEVSLDPEHRFELAVQLRKLDTAFQIALEAASEPKWKQLGDLALACWDFRLAEESLIHAKDFSGLLLLYSSSGNADGLTRLAITARTEGRNNIAFLSMFLLGRVEECLDLLVSTKRLPEAAFFARTYAPSHVSQVVSLWRADLETSNKKAAESLADPTEYENLFPDLGLAVKAEQLFYQLRDNRKIPAAAYPEVRAQGLPNLLEVVRLNGAALAEEAPVANGNGDADHGQEEEPEADEELEEPIADAPTPVVAAPAPVVAAPAPVVAAPA
eukprot:Opistho-2@94866